MKKGGSAFALVLKAVVSLGLLFFLLSRIDTGQLLGALSSARLSYLAVALVAYFFSQLISSLRWVFVARPLGFGHSYLEFATFYFIGMFFNLFAPSIIGGDVGRVYYLARERARGEQSWTAPAARAVVTVVVDRAVGMAVLVWIGAAALALYPSYRIPNAIRYAMYGLAVLPVLAWLSLPLAGRLVEKSGLAGKGDVGRALESYWRNPRALILAALCSLGIHFIQASMHLLLGNALDSPIPWSYSFIVYPLVGIFSALPVSVNGIGLREGGYLFLLREIGMSSEKAIAFGILWFLLVAIESLIGAALFILKKRHPAPVASESKDHFR